MITKLPQSEQDQIYLRCTHIKYILVHGSNDGISCGHNHLTHEHDDCFFSFSTAHMRTNTTEGVRRRWPFDRPRRLGAGQGPLGAHRRLATQAAAQGKPRAAAPAATLGPRATPRAGWPRRAGRREHVTGGLAAHHAPGTVCHASRLQGHARHRQLRHGRSRS
jgi:hypothetical protein